VSSEAAAAGLAQCREATSRYYSERLAAHGPVPLGVDWSCEPTQQLRFVQLLKLRGAKRKFSLNDLGCGYGALLAYLDRRHASANIDYLGTDISEAMIAEARKLWAGRTATRFEVGHASSREADFSVASGIFNVRMNLPPEDWTACIADTLDGMHATSRLGFAVNFLTPAPAPPTVTVTVTVTASVTASSGLPAQHAQPTQTALYRAPPATWATYCEQRFGWRVEVLCGYGMREYTLLVRKPSGNA
jgi:SAM-dependent methyltransferase